VQEEERDSGAQAPSHLNGGREKRGSCKMYFRVVHEETFEGRTDIFSYWCAWMTGKNDCGEKDCRLNTSGNSLSPSQ